MVLSGCMNEMIEADKNALSSNDLIIGSASLTVQETIGHYAMRAAQS